MACTNKFTIWLGRANIQELVIREPIARGGDLVTDLSGYTKVTLSVGGYEVSSETAPTAIWWDDSETRTVPVDGVDQDFTGDIVKLQVGPELAATALVAGAYQDGNLIAYDASHVEGAVVADNLKITVVDL